jgi:hypothetical protein
MAVELNMTSRERNTSKTLMLEKRKISILINGIVKKEARFER